MAFALLPATLTLLSGQPRSIQSGEAFAAGAAVRIDSTGRLVKVDSEVLATSDMAGIALSESNAANQWVTYAPPGCKLTVSGLVAGESYWCGGSGDAGEVGLRADAVTGTHYGTLAGVTHSTTIFEVLGIKTGVAVA